MKFANKISSSQLKRFGQWSGIIGPLSISLGILISGLGYIGVQGQHYSPLNHFVSELGQVGVSDLALAFNLALILGGIFNTGFLVYLAFQVQNWTRYPLLVLGSLASIFGALVGIYPMNYIDQHIFVALTFFDLGLIIALLYSLVFLFGKNHPFPRWLAIPGLFNTAAFLIFINFPPQFEKGVEFQDGMGGLLLNRPDIIPLAIMEWIVISGIIFWFLIMGIYLVSSRSRQLGS